MINKVLLVRFFKPGNRFSLPDTDLFLTNILMLVMIPL